MKYNPAFVYFEPSDDLIGKWCIVADSVYKIKEILTADNDFIKRQLIQLDNTEDVSNFPFRIVNDNPDVKEESCWKFVYVDPAFQDMMREKPGVLRRDLARWLALGYGQVLSLENDRVYTHFYYDVKDEDVPVDREKFKVREWNETEWKDVEAILNEEYQ